MLSLPSSIRRYLNSPKYTISCIFGAHDRERSAFRNLIFRSFLFRIFSQTRISEITICWEVMQKNEWKNINIHMKWMRMLFYLIFKFLFLTVYVFLSNVVQFSPSQCVFIQEHISHRKYWWETTKREKKKLELNKCLILENQICRQDIIFLFCLHVTYY